MLIVVVANAFTVVRGQNTKDNDTKAERVAIQYAENAQNDEGEYDEYDDEGLPSTTTTTTTTTFRPRQARVRLQSRPSRVITSRNNHLYDQERSESQTKERISQADDDNSYFSRRYARFLFKQRSG